MSNAMARTSFLPKEQTRITMGPVMLFTYPRINHLMNDSEKAYAFMINKNAISSANLTAKIKNKLFFDLTEATALSNVIDARYLKFANDYVRSINNLKVVSYHDNLGKNIKNCTSTNAGGKRELKTYTGVNNTSRHPENISYVKIKADINFGTLDKSSNKLHPFTYFLRLENETITPQDDKSADLDFISFLVDNNWAFIQKKFYAVFDNPYSIKKPFDLLMSSDINGETTLQVDICIQRIETIAHRASWPNLTKSIFEQICPSILQDPVAILQNIKQTTINKVTKSPVLLSVQKYFTSIQNMTSFFPASKNWTIDVTNHFLTHLDDTIKSQMENTAYRYNSLTASKEPFEQIIALQKDYSAALSAETALKTIEAIATKTMAAQSALSAAIPSYSITESTIRRKSS